MRAQQGDVQAPRRLDVVDVAPGADEEPMILAPLQRPTHPRIPLSVRLRHAALPGKE